MMREPLVLVHRLGNTTDRAPIRALLYERPVGLQMRTYAAFGNCQIRLLATAGRAHPSFKDTPITWG